MQGTPTKTTRNNKLVAMKLKGITFKEIAKRFNISEARGKQIFYRAKQNSQ